MKRILFFAVITATTILNTGCGSFICRLGHDLGGSNAKLGVYPGVRTDTVIIFTAPVRTFDGDPLALLTVPFFAADMPLSAVLDTGLLPHDLSKNN